MFSVLSCYVLLFTPRYFVLFVISLCFKYEQ